METGQQCLCSSLRVVCNWKVIMMLRLNISYLMKVLEQREVSISEFCESYIGVPRSTYYTWMNDPGHVRIDDVQMIADALRVPVIDLLIE